MRLRRKPQFRTLSEIPPTADPMIALGHVCQAWDVRFDIINAKFAEIRTRLEDAERRLGSLEQRVEVIESSQAARFSEVMRNARP